MNAWGNHRDVNIWGWHYLVIVDIEPAGKLQDFTFRQIRLDIIAEDLSVKIVGHQQNADIGTPDNFVCFQDFETRFLRRFPGHAVRHLANNNVTAAVP